MANTSTTELDLLKTVTTTGGASDNLHVVVDSGSVSVTGSITTQPAGKTSVTLIRNDYSSVNVTTAGYVQIVASLSGAVTAIQVFDSSGQTLVLATGGAGAEVDQIYITPGGNDYLPLAIGAGVRVSVKAVSATASSGELDINFLA